VELGKVFTEWEDAAHIYGKLAILHARTGDYQGAQRRIWREPSAPRAGTGMPTRCLGTCALRWRGCGVDLAEARSICRGSITELAAVKRGLPGFPLPCQGAAWPAELRAGTGSAGPAHRPRGEPQAADEALGFRAEGGGPDSVAAVVDGSRCSRSPRGYSIACNMLHAAHRFR